jgi:uncharacterized iron-regulated protein
MRNPMIFEVKSYSRLFLSVVSVLVGLTQFVASQSVHHPASGYLPQRVYDSNEKRFSDFESMLADLSGAEVVFVGEQHDDPATHRLERAILEGLSHRRGNIVVALEMFERDVQMALDNYLAGRLSEEEFLSSSRPWPRYATDYRPLVEFARVRGWRVVASNVPRRYASEVSKQGLAAVDAVSAAERKLIASQIQCPMDEYFNRFSAVMNGHPAEDGKPFEHGQDDERRAKTERFYYAQCIKDETMAESIADQFQSSNSAQQKPLVVHFNGAFHSDYRLGAAARASRRLPTSKIKVLTVIPIENLDTIKAENYSNRGDYIIFSLKHAK